MLSKYEIEELEKSNKNQKQHIQELIKEIEKTKEYFKNELKKVNDNCKTLLDENENLKFELLKRGIKI